MIIFLEGGELEKGEEKQTPSMGFSPGSIPDAFSPLAPGKPRTPCTEYLRVRSSCPTPSLDLGPSVYAREHYKLRVGAEGACCSERHWLWALGLGRGLAEASPILNLKLPDANTPKRFFTVLVLRI